MLASDPEGATLDALRFSLASEIVELVVLTTDEIFLQTLREAVGGAQRLWHVPSADKVSDLLIAGEVGILVLDVLSLNESPALFVGQIKRQFPDLVVVAAGNRDAETSLAGLISAGIVYRFIHKPMSPGRAKLFADAAVKKYDEQRRRAAATPSIKRGSRSHRGALIGGMIGALGVIVAATWALHKNTPEGVDPLHAAGVMRPSAADSPTLIAAAAALSANRLTEPKGDNALELYSQALAKNPADPAARSGLAEVHERLLARAENALLEERLDEASIAIDTARKSGVESGRIAFLTAQLAKSREHVKSTPSMVRVRTEPKAAQDDGTPLLAVQHVGDGHPPEPQSDSGPAQTLPPSAQPPTTTESPTSGPPLASTQPTVSAMPQTDADAPTQLLTSTTHDLEADAAAREFLANVVPAGELSLVKSVTPEYPSKASSSKIQGWVELDFTVNDRGGVTDISVHATNAPGVFEEAATRALAQWRYKPVSRDGKTVAQRARIRMRFALAG